MVMPCCSMCYQKYLNQDGALNKEGLDAIYGKNAYKIIEDTESKKVIQKGFQKIKLCSCICHTVGMNVMH